MTKAAPAQPVTVLCASMALPEVVEGQVPEWVHLTPTLQGEITTFDGRGPFLIQDAAAVIAASMALPRGIPVDENHATDRAAALGQSAPARGWIKEMEARADGIWGRVEWTKAGRELMADKAYRGISPALTLHDDEKTVRAIPRASVTNLPNLRSLTALHTETSMATMAKLAAALGLAEGASEDDCVTAITALKDKKGGGDTTLQSALKDIGVVLGVEGEAKPEAVLAAARVHAGGKTELTTLQTEVTTLKGEIATLKSAGSRKVSEAYIDKAIADRRAGINAGNREEMISLHMSQPVTAEKIITGMPMLSASGTQVLPPEAKDGVTALNSEQKAACVALGVSEEAFLKTLAAEQKERA